MKTNLPKFVFRLTITYRKDAAKRHDVMNEDEDVGRRDAGGISPSITFLPCCISLQKKNGAR